MITSPLKKRVPKEKYEFVSKFNKSPIFEQRNSVDQQIQFRDFKDTKFRRATVSYNNSPQRQQEDVFDKIYKKIAM